MNAPESAAPAVSSIVERLRGQIHRGELGPGDRLHPERQLAAEMGISRQRVRDALAALEADGYLAARRGVGGGWFVTELAIPFQAWVGRTRNQLDDIVDFRLAVECQAARFAAERRTGEDLRAMARAVEMLAGTDDPSTYRHADVAFHGAVAIAARSRRLFAAVEQARGELFEPTEELWHDHKAAESWDFHDEIRRAIEAADADAAAGGMARHIETTRTELRRLIKRM